MKKFFKIFPAKWREVVAAVLTAVAIFSAITFGWWLMELTVVLETPPGKMEWGFVICPVWLGLGGLAMAVIAMVIREKFFPPKR